jgi:transcriptional regulator with XRE-family HTH domain
MLTPNGNNVRKLRLKRGWSLDRLSAEAGVNRQTIYRLESGKTKTTRSHTLDRLAKALQTTSEVLCGDEIDVAAIAQDTTPKSQMNVRLPRDVRNAISLVAVRYGVNASSIIEAAPLLFLCAAELSLQARQEKLDRYQERLSEIDADDTLPHVPISELRDWRMDAALSREQESIDARDIFGGLVHEFDEDAEFYGVSFVDSEKNPLVEFVRNWVKQIKGASLDSWHPEYGASFEIGREDASALVGGDEEAIGHIMAGRAAIHELPRELRKQDDTVGRAKWAREQGEQWLRDHPPVDIDQVYRDLLDRVMAAKEVK